MITEPTLPIEAKGRDIVHAENHLHVVMSSNEDWVVPAGVGARRFAVFDVPSTHKGDAAYFAALFDHVERGGLAAMLHEMLAWDIGRWHPETARPDTEALERQKVQSLRPLERVLFECLETGEVSTEFGDSLGDGGVLLQSTPFVDWVKRRTGRDEVTTTKLGDLSKKLGFVKREDTRPRGWELPLLAEARQRWDQHVFRYSGWSAEPPRVSRRLPDMRGWSHGRHEIFDRGPRAGSSVGVGAGGGARL